MCLCSVQMMQSVEGKRQMKTHQMTEVGGWLVEAVLGRDTHTHISSLVAPTPN